VTISTALKRWRSKRSLSQAEAAAKLAVSLRTFQEWEQARREPSGKALPALWRVLAQILNPQATLNGSFAELLKDYRKQTRQNRGEAAKCLSVSAGAIKDWEQERRVPSGATVARLLPLFEAASEKWKRARSAPPSAEETRLIAMLRSRTNGRPGRRKRVFADPKEGRKATLEWLKHTRAELEKRRGEWGGGRWREYLQKRVESLERDLRRYERRVAEARAKAARAKRRLASRQPRRKSPVLPFLPE
jgi:DNA-binding transcriptional regulator YiaG